MLASTVVIFAEEYSFDFLVLAIFGNNFGNNR